jgi:ABC-type phosphate transport system substrate-binding protein
MFRNRLMRTTAFAGVLAVVSTGAFATTVTSGGATLPQPTYTAEEGYLHTLNPTVNFSYYGVGSGAGQTALLNNDSTQFGIAAGTSVSFGASDAALSAAQVSGYSRTATDGHVIQIPQVGTAVTVAFPTGQIGALTVTNPGKPTGKAVFTPITTNGTFSLNDSDLCGIFSGKITDWSGISTKGLGTKPAVTTGTGVTAASPIKVAYRTDSSGTTFLFTQHLAAVCTPATNKAGVTFTTTKTFAATIFPGGVPPNFVGGSGSGGVAAALEGVSANIGYISPDYTAIAPNSANTAHHSLLVSKLHNTTDGGDYLPTVANTTTGLSGVTAANYPVTSAATAANPLNWVPLIAKPPKGYPIVGFTNTLFVQCYKDPNVAAAVKLFIQGNVSTSAVPSFISGVAPYGTVVANNGFVAVPSFIASLITNHIVNNVVTSGSTWNLNIQNATACTGKTGR